MQDFWELYSWIEDALKLDPDEFAKNEEIKKRAIKGIRGLAMILVNLGKKLLKMDVSERELPMTLANAKIISGSTADELSELIDLEQRAEELEPQVIYSNLVRFMEVFEEVYFAMSARLSEQSKR